MKFAIAALLGLAAASDKIKELDPSPAYYTPFDHEATYYERVTTPRFSADTDDIFMRSMIEQYALEERNSVFKDTTTGLSTGGEPSGKFWMNKPAAYAASDCRPRCRFAAYAASDSRLHCRFAAYAASDCRFRCRFAA